MKPWQEKIRSLRAKAELTQQEFAEALKIAISTVANWEGGIAQPGRMAQERIREFASKLEGKEK